MIITLIKNVSFSEHFACVLNAWSPKYFLKFIKQSFPRKPTMADKFLLISFNANHESKPCWKLKKKQRRDKNKAKDRKKTPQKPKK